MGVFNLAPTYSNTIKIEAIIPDASALGDSVRINVSTFIENSSGNLQPSKSYSYISEIRCAYDPNDKLVRPNRSNQYDKNYTLFEETLEYTVRFQNTGNDTAFTVVIQDQLDENLDWTTFKPLTSSHNFETLLNKDGLVEFSFKNILLPDSTTNEPLSHGFVSYQIKAKKDLAENTAIQNTANIYFDANPPITTNTTENVLVSELPKTTSTNNWNTTSAISFYPNPTNSLLRLKIEEGISANQLEIYFYSSIGKLERIYRAENILDVSNFPAGIYFTEVRQNGKIIDREKILISR